jgi:Zn-dependent oligopeptidase
LSLSHFFRGFIFIDLFPRPNKYSHAAHLGVIHALKPRYPHTVVNPAVSVLMCNFPKPSADRDSLLMHSDVVTFFHEFGHAMHHVLGATEQPGFAGTNVKTDFVEVMSQV